MNYQLIGIILIFFSTFTGNLAELLFKYNNQLIYLLSLILIFVSSIFQSIALIIAKENVISPSLSSTIIWNLLFAIYLLKEKIKNIHILSNIIIFIGILLLIISSIDISNYSDSNDDNSDSNDDNSDSNGDNSENNNSNIGLVYDIINNNVDFDIYIYILISILSVIIFYIISFFINKKSTLYFLIYCYIPAFFHAFNLLVSKELYTNIFFLLKEQKFQKLFSEMKYSISLFLVVTSFTILRFYFIYKGLRIFNAYKFIPIYLMIMQINSISIGIIILKEFDEIKYKNIVSIITSIIISFIGCYLLF